MIPRTAAARPIPAWQASLGQAVSSVGELLAMLDLDPGLGSLAAARDFPLRVPRGFVARMKKGDPDDPLLRQVLPLAAETLAADGYLDDPLAEAAVTPTPGVLHKFRGRVLLVSTGACAVHCRYCFRRHFPYGAHQPWEEGWRAALDYLAGDASIDEVILSGGDPLALSDQRLAALALALADIPHLMTLRLHTRLPIVLPERVDQGLLAWLGGSRLRPVVVVHANHANEVDGAVAAACARLRAAGATVLNQSVLLRGVNDDAGVLRDLSRALFDAGVLPYYLHLLDPVRGASHFEVDPVRALGLHRELAASLPGYLLPRLVREVPGAAAKVAIGPAAAADHR